MKLKVSLSSVLGIIGAITVPAVVFAQFQPQQRLLADDLNALADGVVQVGPPVTAFSLPSNPSTGAIATATYRAQADGVVILGTAGDAVTRTGITAGIEIDGALRTIWRTTGGDGVTFTVRDGQRFNVGGLASSSSGQSLAASIIVYWMPLTADDDVPVLAN